MDGANVSFVYLFPISKSQSIHPSIHPSIFHQSFFNPHQTIYINAEILSLVNWDKGPPVAAPLKKNIYDESNINGQKGR